MLGEVVQNKTTRDRVLQTLLTRQRCTINELAEVVEINPISVRHHINRLEAEGLVTSEEERHGVGRPRRLYFLTEAGQELFPTRYLRLTIRLLEQLKETAPPSLVNALFTQMADEIVTDHEKMLDGLSLEQKLDLVASLLSQEGFKVNWQLRGDHYAIIESNCPYFRVGQDHPEVCSVDQTVISRVLSVPAEKIQCMLRGDHACTYLVPAIAQTEVKEHEKQS